MIILPRLLLAFVLLTSASCKEHEEAAVKPAVEPLSAAEVERGHDACRTYIERLCRCAAIHPEYAEECELIRHARPDAILLTYDAQEGYRNEVARRL